MTSRAAPVLILFGSIAVVGGALFSQYVGGLQPCELCLLERWPYYLAIPVALLALVTIGNRSLTTALMVIAALLFLGSAGLGFYHVGVEQHWIAGPTACTGSGGGAKTVEELTAQLFKQQVVQCDQVQWSLFGISLAGFNFLASLVLLGIALRSLRTRRYGRRRR